jgi:serine/threonine protein kinase
MKVLAPRIRTAPASARGGADVTGRLPDDLLEEQTRRLVLVIAVGSGLWAFGTLMDTVIIPLTMNITVPRAGLAINLIALMASAAILIYVKWGNCALHSTPTVGIVYMIVNAFAVAMLNTWAQQPTVDSLGRLSWITIVIFVCSMIVPTSPRRMLAGTLVAASMDPLGVWFAHLRGIPVPSVVNTLVLCMPNYVCAVIATLPSHVLNRLGRRLREAQDLGSYKLVELLGHGGMGEVWRAEHRLLARGAAVKIVRPELLGMGSDTEARLALRRFEREAQATASLSSPHTIQVFDFGITEEGTFYYVMELLAGRDLETLIREFGPLPADRAIFLLRQVCHSLADAHTRGLVHRDIKPANIYLCRMGLDYDFVKVLDFGLVKFRDRSSMRTTMMTVEQSTTGTPAYMAPEIILGESDVDSRADVYALGCVAYYLLTGRLVFEADTSMKMLMQHVQARPAPPSEATELPIPHQLDQLVLACLEKDPNKRPQSARELFALAEECKACETWTQNSAKAWWETHLPELTGQLTLGTPGVDRSETAGRSLASI